MNFAFLNLFTNFSLSIKHFLKQNKIIYENHLSLFHLIVNFKYKKKKNYIQLNLSLKRLKIFFFNINMKIISQLIQIIFFSPPYTLFS